MNAALIVMTILGCNDNGTDCHYIATASERWPTVAMCDSVSEQHLPNYVNAPYPVLIAVCQNPDIASLPENGPVPQPAPVNTPESPPVAAQPEQAATAQPDANAAVPPQVEEEKERTLAGRAIDRVRRVLPTTEGVKTLVNKPVRLVEDSYSWVARRFEK